ncbi:hypothetical protein KC354_g121 [Hortaea werneckii]|nr:hypothetical protein KC354_g121 [Hortaea werneckii]
MNQFWSGTMLSTPRTGAIVSIPQRLSTAPVRDPAPQNPRTAVEFLETAHRSPELPGSDAIPPLCRFGFLPPLLQDRHGQILCIEKRTAYSVAPLQFRQQFQTPLRDRADPPIDLRLPLPGYVAFSPDALQPPMPSRRLANGLRSRIRGTANAAKFFAQLPRRGRGRSLVPAGQNKGWAPVRYPRDCGDEKAHKPWLEDGWVVFERRGLQSSVEGAEAGTEEPLSVSEAYRIRDIETVGGKV